jgi:hypothetical protein
VSASTLVDSLLAGDADAIAGFRDAHLHQVMVFCTEACPEGLHEEARDAAFVNFLGRVAAPGVRDGDLEKLLLKSTRSAAAGRFNVQVPAGAHVRGNAPSPACLAMPELMAADANGELTGDAAEAQQHLDECPVCLASAERMGRAEEAYQGAVGWSEQATEWIPARQTASAARGARARQGWGPPGREVDEPPPATLAPDPQATGAPEPPEPPEPAEPPEPEPEAAAPDHQATIRRRSGGIVGAARRAWRPRG